MAYQQYAPHPSLQEFIHFYWTFSGCWTNRETIRLLPDTTLDILINLGENVYSLTEEPIMLENKPYLIGISNRFDEHYLQGITHLFGIRFKAGAFNCFYSYDPMHLFTNKVYEFDIDLFPRPDQQNTFSTTYLDRYFLNRLKPPRNTILPIVSFVHEHKGLLKIDELARKFCITGRQLERVFKDQLGLSPKSYSKLVQFRHTYQQIKRYAAEKNLFDIAFGCGYYDQSQLSNDIKRYTGIAPSAILSDFSKVEG